MNDKHFGQLFSPVFSDLERDTLARVTTGNVQEEDHITSTLFTLAEERINRLGEELGTTISSSSLVIKARQFQGRGTKSDEFFSGADGAVVLRIKLGSMDIQKVYLFQAKKSTQWKFDDHAVTQRDRMLHCTPDGFFLIYSPKAIKVISAFIVEKDDKYTDLPNKSFVNFNEDFFDCFIGDHFNGFLDLPYGRPWRYWPYDYPPAKNNLAIVISEREG